MVYIHNAILLSHKKDGSVVKNPPANAGDERDKSSIPGLGRCPGGGMATRSSIIAWSIP